MIFLDRLMLWFGTWNKPKPLVNGFRIEMSKAGVTITRQPRTTATWYWPWSGSLLVSTGDIKRGRERFAKLCCKIINHGTVGPSAGFYLDLLAMEKKSPSTSTSAIKPKEPK